VPAFIQVHKRILDLDIHKAKSPPKIFHTSVAYNPQSAELLGTHYINKGTIRKEQVGSRK
jgi:hypothetical protein